MVEHLASSGIVLRKIRKCGLVRRLVSLEVGCEVSKAHARVTNHHLTGFKAHFMRWNPCVTLLEWPRSETR